MRAVEIDDKEALEAFLLKHRELNYYPLGDLDDFFWPHTTWHGLKKDGEIQAVALIYRGTELPVLLAINNDNPEEMLTLLGALRETLPEQIYAHLSPGFEPAMQSRYQLTSHGEHYKMVLKDPGKIARLDVSHVEALGRDDLQDLLALYEASYPGNWFDPRMLDTGQYFGIREVDGSLVSAAGVHVFSPKYKIAAIGNITTLPERRGQGLGTAAVSKLCQSLLESVEVIGLNVRTDNTAAIQVYEKLGFESVAIYHEYMLNELSPTR